MITANHLIYDILEMASSGANPNDFKISNNQILYWVEQTRSILISQALNKRDDINDSWIQYIGCIELEQVDKSSCCLVETDCYILKSTKQIPATIDSWKDNNIISVTTIEGDSIPKSNVIKQRYQKYNKYTKNQKAWFLKDDYLYIINDQLLTNVSLSGLFETPSDLGNFVDCSGQSCWSLDSNYPVSLTLATQITDIIMKTKVNPFMSYAMDTTNDSNAKTDQQKIISKQAKTNSNQ